MSSVGQRIVERHQIIVPHIVAIENVLIVDDPDAIKIVAQAHEIDACAVQRDEVSFAVRFCTCRRAHCGGGGEENRQRCSKSGLHDRSFWWRKVAYRVPSLARIPRFHLPGNPRDATGLADACGITQSDRSEQGAFMSHFRIRRCVTLAMVAVLLAPAALPQGMKPARESGSAFQCEDGTKLELAFDLTGNGLDVLVTLRGAVHRLPYMEPEPGPTQGGVERWRAVADMVAGRQADVDGERRAFDVRSRRPPALTIYQISTRFSGGR
jgi:hypothetical protein